MAFELPDLPYAKNALEPHISANTFDFHYGKHHNAYVTNLNAMVADTPLASMSLEDIMKTTSGDPAKAGIFNNAAQVWNHTFFWNSMKPGGGGAPSGGVADAINGAFGDYANFKKSFKTAGMTQFGSGWVWLVSKNGILDIVKTPNAECPLNDGAIPIITCDVWEHAYYLDYQNRRPDFLEAFLNHLVNWDFANANFA